MKEIKRIKIMHEVEQGRMTAKGATEVLGISFRQVRRLSKKQKKQGDIGLVHGNQGKPSPRRIAEEIRERIVDLKTIDLL